MAVSRVDLNVEPGHLHALLGPSGCGKTTLLRLVCGLEVPDEGSVELAGRQVCGGDRFVAPEARRVGLVFQDYALFPHLTVRGNVGFGLATADVRQRGDRVDSLLELVGLEGLGDRTPDQLSGGERQRVALARALAPQPDVLLLDEPFSNLDARLRADTRAEVRRILASVGATALLVTHDQEEALSVADRVSVMFDGRVVQTADPETLYHRPATPAVAAFVGRTNFVEGQADGHRVTCALGVLELVEPRSGKVRVLVRPEQVRLAVCEEADTASARVCERRFFGSHVLVRVELENGDLLVARPPPDVAAAVGSRVVVSVRGPVVAW